MHRGRFKCLITGSLANLVDERYKRFKALFISAYSNIFLRDSYSSSLRHLSFHYSFDLSSSILISLLFSTYARIDLARTFISPCRCNAATEEKIRTKKIERKN